MVENIKHLCLDKDGTLIDVHQSWVPITQRRAAKISQFYGLGKESEPLLALAMGVDLKQKRIIQGGPVGYKPRPDIIQAVIGWLGHKNVLTTFDQLNEIFAQVDRDVQMAGDFNATALPGVIEGIKRLKIKGLKISVYTSDRFKNTEKVLKLLGIDGYVDAIVGGDQVRLSKPDPEGFMSACAVVNVPAEHSVYVGDTLDDMRMAAGHGYAVAQGLYSKKELARAARKVFDTFFDLTDFLLNDDSKKIS